MIRGERRGRKKVRVREGEREREISWKGVREEGTHY